MNTEMNTDLFYSSSIAGAIVAVIAVLVGAMLYVIFKRKETVMIIGSPDTNGTSNYPSHLVLQGISGPVAAPANATDYGYYGVRNRKERRSRKGSRSLKPRK